MGDRMSLYIGIDPGKTGAVALVGDPIFGSQVWDLDTEQGPAQLKCVLALRGEPNVLAVIEGPDGRPGHHTTRYLVGCGRVQGWCQALGIPIKVVQAALWKPRMGVSGGTRGKKESLDLARELFPECAGRLTRVKDHGRAEALLLAEYGRRYL